VGVEVVDVVNNEPFELVLVPDELSADGSDPSFGECVGYRRADRCLEALEAFGSECLVEGVDELAASVAG